MIVVVTGLMRSGTSLLSHWLNDIGVPMGVSMAFPQAGGQLDWEDREFTLVLRDGLVGRRSQLEVYDFMYRYIRSRQENVLYGGKTWGVKTPFLLPYLKAFKRIAKRCGESVKVVQTVRDIEQTFKSIEEQTEAFDDSITNVAKSLQNKLIEHLNELDEDPDLYINIEESWSSPVTVIKKLETLVRS